MMDRDDADETSGSQCSLSVSDWVTFLSSEKHGMTGTVLSYGAFLVALVAIILGGTGEGTSILVIGGGIIALVLVGIGYFSVLDPARQRAKLAQKTLERVMSCELKDERSIRTEWEAGIATLKRTPGRRMSSGK